MSTAWGSEASSGSQEFTITWVKQVGTKLPDAYAPATIPEVGELGELETFIGSKETKSGFGQRLTTAALES
jgi:hypothetical protein